MTGPAPQQTVDRATYRAMVDAGYTPEEIAKAGYVVFGGPDRPVASDATRQLPLETGRRLASEASQKNREGATGSLANAAMGTTLNLLDEVPGLGVVGDRARAFQRTHPFLAGVSQLAGGLAVPLPGAAAAYRAAKPASLAGKAVLGGAIGGGAAFVNAAGAKEGDIGGRVAEGLRDAPLGIALGASLPLVAPLARAGRDVIREGVRSPRKGLAVARTGYRALTSRAPHPGDAATLASWRPPWIRQANPLDEALPRDPIDPMVSPGDFTPSPSPRPFTPPEPGAGARRLPQFSQTGTEEAQALATPFRPRAEPPGIGAPPSAPRPIRRQGSATDELSDLGGEPVPFPRAGSPTSPRSLTDDDILGLAQRSAREASGYVPQAQTPRTMSGQGYKGEDAFNQLTHKLSQEEAPDITSQMRRMLTPWDELANQPGTVNLPAAGAGRGGSTVQAIQAAKAAVGPGEFRRLVEAEIAKRGGATSHETIMAATEEVARRIASQ